MRRAASRARVWAEIFERLQQSGLSKAEFCRQNGLALSSLKNWLYKTEYRAQIDQILGSKPSRRQTRSPRFVPLSLVADHPSADSSFSPSSRSQPALEVLLGSGRRIVVTAGFDAETLRRLIGVLEDRPC